MSADPTVEFAGERFRTRKKIGAIALLRFAHVANKGTDSASLEGLAAMYELLEAVIAKDEWVRFQQHAADAEADDTQLMKVVADVTEMLAKRPTERPSDSSDGPTSTPQNSEDDSSSRTIRRFEQEGRPDLALMVVMAQEDRAAHSAA
jgi:hypothetical protein